MDAIEEIIFDCNLFDFSKWDIKYIEKPFPLHKIFDVISDKKYLQNLREQLKNLPFEYDRSDLFSLSRSASLKNIEIEEFNHVFTFINFLRALRRFIELYFSIELNDQLSLTCSRYDMADYLLCHDDKVDNRSIAFVFYLNEEWKEEWGGSFDLFGTDGYGQPQEVSKRIYPDCNSLLLFKVSSRTYHQVAEVVGDVSRITINGWYHQDYKLIEVAKPIFIVPSAYLLSVSPISMEDEMREFTTDAFLDDEINEMMIDIFMEKEECCQYDNFLQTHMYNELCEELRTSVTWKKRDCPRTVGKYDICDIHSLSPTLRCLHDMFSSCTMVSYLSKITNILLEPHEHVYIKIELQRWTAGCYSLMLDDGSTYRTAVLDLFIFFNVDSKNVKSDERVRTDGCVFYNKKKKNTVYHVTPISNAISLVKREKNDKIWIMYNSEKYATRYNAFYVTYSIDK